MAVEIPGQLRFEHLLFSTFPGFFSVISVFMLIDIWSPIDFTSWVMEDISGFVSFIGVVVLLGTIFGIIIDGLHHSIMEGNIFDKFIEVRKINEFSKALVPRIDVGLYSAYYFNKVNKAMEINEYLLNKRYYYSEFYTNTFISIIPFGVILPFYLFYVLQIPWSYSLSLGLILLSIGCECLNRGYISYKIYFHQIISAICGYLDFDTYIHIEKIPYKCIKKSENSKLEVIIEARIIGIASQIPILKEGINVNFTPTLGKMATTVGTNESGIAKAKLILDLNHVRSGISIVTVSADKCIPGSTLVRFGDRGIGKNPCV